MPAKVYDRPEGQKFSPILIVVAVIVLLIVGFGLYRWQFAPAAQPSSPAAPASGQSSLGTEGVRYGRYA